MDHAYQAMTFRGMGDQGCVHRDRNPAAGDREDVLPGPATGTENADLQIVPMIVSEVTESVRQDSPSVLFARIATQGYFYFMKEGRRRIIVYSCRPSSARAFQTGIAQDG